MFEVFKIHHISDNIGFQTGLEQLDVGGGSFGIFDGSSMRISSSKYSVVTMAKLFWRYGMDIYNMDSWINEKLLSKFMR